MSDARTDGIFAPVLTFLLALVLLWAVGAKLWTWRESRGPATASRTAAPGADTPGATGRPAAAPPGADAAAARARARERVRRDASGTYILPMLADMDSVLHRWPDSLGRPVRVAVLRGGVRNWSDDYAHAADWAVSHWDGAGLTVRFQTGADSASADVLMVWSDSLGGLREGRADVTMTGSGDIVRVVLLLGARAPSGRPHTAREMVTIALHEFGHAVGLGHSPDSADALYPMSTATDLTARDRRTAALLYALPAGSLKN